VAMKNSIRITILSSPLKEKWHFWGTFSLHL
jgi:hypothetical protein